VYLNLQRLLLGNKHMPDNINNESLPQGNFSERLRELIENPRTKEAFQTVASRDLAELNNIVWGELDNSDREALDALTTKYRSIYKTPILVLSMKESYDSLSGLVINLSTMLFTRVRIEGADRFSADRATEISDDEIIQLEKYIATIEELGKANPGRHTDVFTDSK
jgi:hypothetical protein